MLPLTTQQLSRGGSFFFPLKLSLSLGNAVFDVTVYHRTRRVTVPDWYCSRAGKGVVGWEVVGIKNGRG